MNKTKITRFIEKYFLGGLVENALMGREEQRTYNKG